MLAAFCAASVARAEMRYEWRKVTTSAPWAPRDGAGALVFKDRLWLLGGWNPNDKVHFPRICNNEVWSSEDGLDWTLVKPNTYLDSTFSPVADWEGRHTAGYVVFKDRMWIVGGDANQRYYINDIWNSADGRTWTRVAEKAPWAPRVLHHTFVFKDRIWVMGGQTVPQFAAADEVFHRDVWTSADGVEWEQVRPQEPYWESCGLIGGSAIHEGRIWVLGGATYDTPKRPVRYMANSVWSSADGVHWTCHTEQAPWVPRDYQDVAVFDGRLWLLEGHDGKSNRNDVWYSSDGANWTEVPDTPWKPRHAASVFVYKNALWMVGGNNMESDVWRLVRR
jgi:hypothetical protein